MEDLSPLGWENNTKYAVESAKVEGRKPRAPHPLYETLRIVTCLCARAHCKGKKERKKD